ncbi:hypothetical protein MJO29_014430 [Puccinia striiformis f. sp. tritici]|nr:hypothetical protein MJO29_014430 [Puccinia striiformis f. sp. tritici]
MDNSEKQKSDVTEEKKIKESELMIETYVSVGFKLARTPIPAPAKNQPDCEREPTRAVESRWGIIIHRANKYCGCFLQVKQRLGSRKGRDDIMDDSDSNGEEILGASRPEGCKAAKKQQYNNNVPVVLQEGPEELIKISREKSEATATVADNAIMVRNLANLDKLSLAFYANQKKSIAIRWGLI